ncbi:MAG: PEGA domain-containing protein, partial [bacterium]|nr:PEGA domain-containing protein [bacterium]
VTPGNILLAGGTAEELLANPGRDPAAKLVDFGIAGLMGPSELSTKLQAWATLGYAPPELIDPRAEVTAAADVYGAAAVVYRLLTGELATGRFADPSELRPELDPDVDEVLLAALQRSPERRPAAAELATRAAALVERRVQARAVRVKRLAGLAAEVRRAVAQGDHAVVRAALAGLEAADGDGASQAVIDETRSWLQAEEARREHAQELRTKLEQAHRDGREAEVREQLIQLRSSLGAGAAEDGAILAAEAWLAERKRAAQQAAQRRQRIEAQRAALATALEAGDEARVERAAADLEQELGKAGPADRDLSEARTWLDAQRTKRRAEEAKDKAKRERLQPEPRPSPAPSPVPTPKRSSVGLLVLLAIAVVVIAVVLWATLERGPWGAAKDSTATAIPATITPPTATPRPTNTAVPVPEQGEVEIRSSGPGGTAWLDGERVGMTPQTVRVAPGRHQVKVTRPGCEAAERWL